MRDLQTKGAYGVQNNKLGMILLLASELKFPLFEIEQVFLPSHSVMTTHHK